MILRRMEMGHWTAAVIREGSVRVEWPDDRPDQMPAGPGALGWIELDREDAVRLAEAVLTAYGRYGG